MLSGAVPARDVDVDRAGASAACRSSSASRPGRQAHLGRLLRGGSITATFAQGVMLGAIVDGSRCRRQISRRCVRLVQPVLDVQRRGLVFGYALLGCTWLIMKTEGELQNIAFALTRPLVVVVVAFMGLVSTWLPFLSSQIMARWFDERESRCGSSPVPLLALVQCSSAVASGDAARRLHAVHTRADFFALGSVGLVLGMWPNICCRRI